MVGNSRLTKILFRMLELTTSFPSLPLTQKFSSFRSCRFLR